MDHIVSFDSRGKIHPRNASPQEWLCRWRRSYSYASRSCVQRNFSSNECTSSPFEGGSFTPGSRWNSCNGCLYRRVPRFVEDPGEDWSGKDQTIRSDGSRWLESTSQQTAETINGGVTWRGGGDTGAIGEVWVIPESKLLNVDLDVDGRWCARNKTNWFVNIYIYLSV